MYQLPHVPCDQHISVSVYPVFQSHSLSHWFLLSTFCVHLLVDLYPPGQFPGCLLMLLFSLLASYFPLFFSAAITPCLILFSTLLVMSSLYCDTVWGFVDPIYGHAHTLSVSSYYFTASFPQVACPLLCFVASGNPTGLCPLSPLYAVLHGE